MIPDGTVKCNFCHIISDAEVVRTFHLKITLADKSAKVLAWCTGQTAMDLLQISPEEFNDLPEVIFLTLISFSEVNLCSYDHIRREATCANIKTSTPSIP